MDHALTRLNQLSRPKLLVKAARLGQQEYNRNRALRRLIQSDRLPAPGDALEDLLQHEDAANAERCTGGAAYSPARHVELLAALMTEAQLLNTAAT